MDCNFPRGANDKDGDAVLTPCGTCIACKLNYASGWNVRLTHESQLHKEKDFITLTFNDENLPKKGSVYVKEAERFIRRLRYNIEKDTRFGCEPKKIRYYMVGEYGEICKKCGFSYPVCMKKGCRKFDPKIGRPHYHAVIFNHQFGDRKTLRTIRKRNTTDYIVYRSGELESLWKKGFSTTTEVNERTTAYIARYVTKKVNGKEKEREHYEGKNPEFAIMSKNPAIGKEWFDKYRTDIFPKGYCYINGKSYPAPRYYFDLWKRIDPNAAFKYQKERRKKAEESEYEDSMRGYHKEKHRSLITRSLTRDYERGL